MSGGTHTGIGIKPKYKWLPGLLSLASVPILFILVLWPIEPYLNIQSVIFAWLALVLSGVSFLTLLIVNSSNRITVEDCIVALLFLWLSASYIIAPVNTPGKYWDNVFIFVIYAALRVILPEYRYLKCVVFVMLMTMLFYEAFLGIRQALGISHGRHSMYPVTGTFFNPGPYGGYLATLMAVAFAYVVSRYEKTKEAFEYVKQRNYNTATIVAILVYGVGILSLITAGIVFLSVFSRSAIVGLGISVLIVLFKHKPFIDYTRDISRSKRNRLIIAGSTLTVIVASAAGLYIAKKDSADGRMLMWKAGIHTFAQHPFVGNGLGTFPARYAEAQAHYFRENPDSGYKSVAGVPEYAFNEYVLAGSETGIIGLGLLLTLLIVAFVKLLRRNSPYAYGLLTLSIFAFFSYPFSILPLKILLILYVASAANERVNRCKKIHQSRFILAGLVLSGIVTLLFAIPVYVMKIEKIKDWKQAAMLREYDREFAVKDYSSLAQWHTDNPAFMFEYGRLHHLVGNYRLSNRILMDGGSLSADPMFQNVIGNNYKALGEISMAEQSYMKAFDILPNRIYPKFLLMNLYEETGDTLKARRVALEIINFNVKIESSATNEIREKAELLLTSKKNSE